MDFSWVSDPKAWVGLLTLVSLEIVLGIDNVVFHLDPGREASRRAAGPGAQGRHRARP
jgi:hypothetical protein